MYECWGSPILEAYDKVTALQRKTLDELAQHMGASAAQMFEQKAGKLDSTIASLSGDLSGLKSSLVSMEQTAQEISKLPDELTTATTSMMDAAKSLTKAANDTGQGRRRAPEAGAPRCGDHRAPEQGKDLADMNARQVAEIELQQQTQQRSRGGPSFSR